ncbi:MAG: peptidylprolyl isomerase [Bacteroidota bacterium]
MKITGNLIHLLAMLLLPLAFGPFAHQSYATNSSEILFSLPDREVTTAEFIRFLEKEDTAYNPDHFDALLQNFIDYHLKLAYGRQQKLDRSIEFVNELTDYRISLAKPYLTHQEKRDFYIQQAYERLKYEINADHILIKMEKKDVSPKDTILFYKQAISVRDQYLHRKNSKETHQTGDTMKKYSFKNLGYFSAFQSEYKFENVVYQLEKGEISMPVRTELGFHIIRLRDKRSVGNLPPLSFLEDKIFESIEKADDERIQAINHAFTEQLKKYWKFKDNPNVINNYKEQLTNHAFTKDISLPLPDNPYDTLCFIDNKHLTINDLWKYMDDVREEEKPEILRQPLEYQVDYFYARFVAHRLYLYENYMLPQKYPEFKTR